jgi:hypothetical protein
MKNGTIWGKSLWMLMFVLLGCAALLLSSCGKAEAKKETAVKTPVEMGKYIVQIGGCNDCHTPGYMEVDGNLPESEWLTGSPVGFKGPWGTSYASNLRLTVQSIDEEAFVIMAKNRNALPPMPWPSLHKMDEEHLRFVYRFIKSLGPKGGPAPKPAAPGVEPETPYFEFVPQHMERLSAK